MRNMNRNKAFILANEIEWENVGEGIERKILGYDEKVMMVHIRFQKGAIGSLHHHIHHQVSFVESGIFEVTINGNTSILKQGDCFFVHPNLVHSVVALENGTLVDVFTPYREDFVEEVKE